MHTMSERQHIERFVTTIAGISPELVEKEFAQRGNWTNVSGHSLIEAARVCVLGDLLQFDAELKKDLALAALLHDGNKKTEIEAIQQEIKAGGSGRGASLGAAREYMEELAGK